MTALLGLDLKYPLFHGASPQDKELNVAKTCLVEGGIFPQEVLALVKWVSCSSNFCYGVHYQ